MGWNRSTAAGLVATVAWAAACSGGDGRSEADVADETTTTVATVEVAASSAYRVTGTIDFLGLDSDIEADVVDSETYALRYVTDGVVDEARRIGDAAYTRFGATVESADERLWTEWDATTGTELGFLLEMAATAQPADVEGATGAELAGGALAELLITDPGALADLDDIDEAETRLEPEVPDQVAEALDSLGVDVPAVELVLVVEGSLLVEAEMEVSSPGAQIDVELAFSDHGEVEGDEVVAPSADEIDPTPWVDEVGLAAGIDTELVAPAPVGLVLAAAEVLPASGTVEGCAQVHLFYDVPPDEAPGGRFLDVFLLPKHYAAAFDPTPFDQVNGGYPSRFDGYEVLVGSTVAQLAPSDELLAELDAVAASLQPTTTDALVASVVPPE